MSARAGHGLDRSGARRCRSHHVGDLVIAPPWLAAETDPRRTMIIDPAMAFGTGEHATTRGVCG